MYELYCNHKFLTSTQSILCEYRMLRTSVSPPHIQPFLYAQASTSGGSKGGSKKSRVSNKALESDDEDNNDKSAQSPIKLCKNNFGTNNLSNTKLND